MTRRQTAQIVAQLGLVRRSARVLEGRLHTQGSEDLVSAGHLGLVQAVLAFDARRFRPGDRRTGRQQFLAWKIWCAQLDAVRGRDLMTGTYRAWQRGSLAQPPRWVSLRPGDPIEDDGWRTEMREDALPSTAPDPEAQAIAADEARVGRLTLRGLLAQVSHRERVILIARYGHGRTWIAIGRDHHVGESRAWQIGADGLNAVRAAMA